MAYGLQNRLWAAPTPQRALLFHESLHTHSMEFPWNFHGGFYGKAMHVTVSPQPIDLFAAHKQSRLQLLSRRVLSLQNLVALCDTTSCTRSCHAVAKRVQPPFALHNSWRLRNNSQASLQSGMSAAFRNNGRHARRVGRPAGCCTHQRGNGAVPDSGCLYEDPRSADPCSQSGLLPTDGARRARRVWPGGKHIPGATRVGVGRSG